MQNFFKSKRLGDCFPYRHWLETVTVGQLNLLDLLQHGRVRYFSMSLQLHPSVTQIHSLCSQFGMDWRFYIKVKWSVNVCVQMFTGNSGCLLKGFSFYVKADTHSHTPFTDTDSSERWRWTLCRWSQRGGGSGLSASPSYTG